MAGGEHVCGCVVRCGQTRAAARARPLVSARGGVLMAFAMALNREDDCKEVYAREFTSLVSYRALARL